MKELKSIELNPSSLAANRILINAISKTFNHAGGNLLDVGCGSRPYESMFQPHINNYWGTDYPITVKDRSKIDVFSDILDLPFKSDHFDTVLCTETIEHCKDPIKAFSELARVLRRGGVLILSTPFIYNVNLAPFDYFRFTKFAIEHLAKQNSLSLEMLILRGGIFSALIDHISKTMWYFFDNMKEIINDLIFLPVYAIRKRYYSSTEKIRLHEIVENIERIIIKYIVVIPQWLFLKIYFALNLIFEKWGHVFGIRMLKYMLSSMAEKITQGYVIVARKN